MKKSNKILLIAAISLSVALGLIFAIPKAQEWLDRPSYTSDEVVAQVKRFLPYSIDEEIVSSYNYNTLYEGKGKWYGNCLVTYQEKKPIRVEDFEGGQFTYRWEEVLRSRLIWYFYEKSQTLEIVDEDIYIPPIPPMRLSDLEFPLAEDTKFPVEIILTHPNTGITITAFLWEGGGVWIYPAGKLGEQIGTYDPETGEFTPLPPNHP